MTYIEYTCEIIKQMPIGEPIYISTISERLSDKFSLENKKAKAAASVAIKRIMDGKLMPDLRNYQKGIYYRTMLTAFGEKGIDKEQIIAEKYILPDKGYETGLSLLHNIGLTTQIPRERIIATNKSKDCIRTDKQLNVKIRPPKVEVNADNKYYLQILDALELLEKAPVDSDKPYAVIANYINKKNLRYDKLLYFADRYYSDKTVLQLAHTASEGGYI